MASVEVMTVCENVCRDFGWVGPVASVLGDLGTFVIGISVIAAFRQLSLWRTEARELRRSTVAEELVALAHNADDALRDIRNPMDSIPKDKIGDRIYPYQRRYERIAKYNELFKDLRNAQIRVRAVIGNENVDQAVEELFKVRNRVAISIELLADYARSENSERSQEDRNHKMKLKRDLYGSLSKEDELGQKISSSVKTIEEQLNPISRLEANK
ncbi:hypothetical protein DL239_08270 [Sedimentitalea sp. CY04]|uniref:Uncharacterized protein n=1 Tax=Parasedimentitalea denitrificans TaxID=2211118 RepID=A0ABX0W5P8_9RHOB|nr:hypothetical protein [Sedimentitalea sp. CY04]NIZ60968.1 hypothetical protein [Sedimentitalea sp. CY04]